MKNEQLALRFNQGKLRYDLVPPSAMKALAEVFTHGAEKYAPRNWEKGLDWESVCASAMRHLEAFRAGEDFDESGLLHIKHVLTNVAFLVEYYGSHPELDNRPKPWLKYNKKIVLDLDDVIFDWTGAFCERYGIEEEKLWWDFSYAAKDKLKELETDKDFWVNLPVKHIPDFVPYCYVTARSIDVEWIKESLEKNNLPCRPIYVVPWNHSKKEILIESGGEILIDDKLENFLDAEEAGLTAYLMDTPANRKFDVGYRRVNSLKIKEILG